MLKKYAYTEEEIKELTYFLERRQTYFNNLSVSHVYDIPSDTPILYYNLYGKIIAETLYGIPKFENYDLYFADKYNVWLKEHELPIKNFKRSKELQNE